jgi:hypothetical protein
MMTEPLWWRLSAGRRFAQGLADLRFEKTTRFLFVGETMIRHASPSRTVTATSGGVHGATTWSCLIAPPSFPLLVPAGFLRAGSDAIVLAAIALPTDKNLGATATTQKRPARHFIGTVKHINPQPSADSGLPPAPSRSSMPPCSGQSRPSPSGGREDAASLDRPCARRLLTWRSGWKNARGAGRTKEWNLPKQYPTRSPTYTRRRIWYLSWPPFTLRHLCADGALGVGPFGRPPATRSSGLSS